jgi:hypothetical protein
VHVTNPSDPYLHFTCSKAAFSFSTVVEKHFYGCKNKFWKAGAGRMHAESRWFLPYFLSDYTLQRTHLPLTRTYFPQFEALIKRVSLPKTEKNK